MAATIDKATIVDGIRNLIVNVNITGDAGGDVSATQLIDMSSYSGSPDTIKLVKVQSALDGFSASLLWDATTDDEIITIPDGNFAFFDANLSGGLTNPKSSGYTGDVMITTNGLATGETGSMLLHFVKKYA